MSTLNVSDLTADHPDPLDQQLVRELEAVFRAHYRMTYRTAYAITGSSEDAEDVVQSIFLRLVRRESPPGLKNKPAAYLYRAAVNLSLNTIRSRKRRTLTGTRGDENPGISMRHVPIRQKIRKVASKTCGPMTVTRSSRAT